MSRYIPVARIIDDNGKPIVGAKTYFYETGTTTLKTIYSDSLLTIPQANPVESLSGGTLPEIHLDGIYKVVQTDENDVQIGQARDPYGNIDAGQFDAWINDKSYSLNDIVKGSDLAFYKSLVVGVETNQGNDPISSPSEWGDATFATLDGTETLTNKTLTDPTITDPSSTQQGQTVITPVFLPTPVNILSYSTLGAVAQTAIDISSHLPVGVAASAAAIHAEIFVSSDKSSAGAVGFSLYASNPSETIVAGSVYKKLSVGAHADIDNGRGVYNSCQFDVGLSSNEFDYLIDYGNISPTGLTTVSIKMHIVGYYV